MEYRPGTCTSCGASYKLPAAFAHDRAKCKQCSGVVEIGPVTSDEAPAAPPPAVPATGVPATGVPAAAAPSAAPKPREGPSMKERLLAKRKSDADATASAAPAAKPAQPASSSARASAASARGASPARPASASGSRAPGSAERAAPTSRTPARRASASRARGAAKGAEEGDASSSRASRSSGRGRSEKPERTKDAKKDAKAERGPGRARSRKSAGAGVDEKDAAAVRDRIRATRKGPWMLIGIAAGIVALLGAGWYFTLGPGGSGESQAAGGDQVAEASVADAGAGAKPANPADEALTGELTALRIDVVAKVEEEYTKRGSALNQKNIRVHTRKLLDELRAEGDSNADYLAKLRSQLEPERISALFDQAAAIEEERKAEEDRKKLEKSDPESIDLTALPDLPRFQSTSDAEWAEVEQLADTFFTDTAAAGTRAGGSLKALHRKALPSIMNRFKQLDVGSAEGVRMGDVVQRSLQEMCNNRTTYSWKYTTERGDHWFNKRAIQLWHGTITQALESDVAWAAIRQEDVSKLPDPMAGGGAATGAAAEKAPAGALDDDPFGLGDLDGDN